jgi:predicted HTH transcriptional regulator
VIEEVRTLIEQRLDEVDAEQRKLHSALKGFGGSKRRKRPGRQRGTRSEAQKAPVASGKRRRSRKGGTRADQALAFIEKHPGSTPVQMADQLKMQRSYAYKVLGDLGKKGKVKKEGSAYWPSV